MLDSVNMKSTVTKEEFKKQAEERPAEHRNQGGDNYTCRTGCMYFAGTQQFRSRRNRRGGGIIRIFRIIRVYGISSAFRNLWTGRISHFE